MFFFIYIQYYFLFSIRKHFNVKFFIVRFRYANLYFSVNRIRPYLFCSRYMSLLLAVSLWCHANNPPPISLQNIHIISKGRVLYD